MKRFSSKIKTKAVALFFVCMLVFSMCFVYAEDLPEQLPDAEDTVGLQSETGVQEESAEGMETMEDSSEGISPMSISDPTKARVIVNTNSYGIPNPNTGYLLEVVPANTNVWVVERSLCGETGKNYYYVGYSYNGKSHRG